MKNITQKVISIFVVMFFLFPIFIPKIVVAANKPCICGIQDMSKKDSNPIYKGLTSISTAADCTNEKVQLKLDDTAKKIAVSNCVWADPKAKKIAQKAEAQCSCKNKAPGASGETNEKKGEVSFTYPEGTAKGELGKFFAISGQAFCSQQSTSQQSCVFVDNVFGSGNIAAKKTPLSTLAKDLNFLQSDDITTIIGRAINIIMGVAGSIAFALFVYAGIMYMFSAGNSEKTKKAKDTMVWASLGILLIFSSYAIITFIFEAVK